MSRTDRPVKIYSDTRQLQNKTFNYRAWAGLSVIRDVLERDGVEVGACDAHNASGCIVLATVPSAPSWYSLVAAWAKGKPKDAILIIGGSGVLNVRPFLALPGAIFVLGRGEGLIWDLVKATQQGTRLDHPSVIYPDTFSPDRTYSLTQGTELYPHPVLLLNNQTWREAAIGCHYRCYFCNYTWTRTAHQAAGDYSPQISDRDAVIAGATNLDEHNLRDLARAWRAGRRLGLGRMINSAIDGQSQRLRKQLKKPVSRQDLIDVAALAPSRSRVSLMTVIGFPTETPEDRAEAIEDLKEGLLQRRYRSPWAVEIAPNAFRPMPATPLALWPTQLEEWSSFLLKEWGAGVEGHRYRIWSHRTRPVGIKTAWGVGGLAHLLLDLIALRGTEADYGAILQLSQTDAFWKANSARRAATLIKHFDTDALGGQYSPETYPVRYLEGHTPNVKLWAWGERALNRLRGDT